REAPARYARASADVCGESAGCAQPPPRSGVSPAGHGYCAHPALPTGYRRGAAGSRRFLGAQPLLCLLYAMTHKGGKMVLSSDQIKLVQDTFALVAPQADEAAQIFYARLFELDPSLRPLFKHDLREQGRKLMQMLSIAVHALDNIESLLPALKALGDRHAGYG